MRSEVLKKIQLMILAFVVLILLCGCKKAEPAKPQGTATSVSETGEQKNCPVMGGKINKDVFTVYKGKKVYFCCPGCKPEFEKDPEKYIAKLPQFSK